MVVGLPRRHHGDMNEQSGPTTTEPPRPEPAGGPRVSAEQMRDVSRLRRSGTDRYVAGVAGGLGRHFDVDPTVVRVLLAVLTFFGGAGLLVYVAVWVLVPEDGQDHAAIELRSDTQRVLLVGAAVVAALIVFGTPFANSDWGSGYVPVLIVLLVGLWIYSLIRNRGRRRHAATPPWSSHPVAPSTATPYSPEGFTTMSVTDAPVTAPETGWQPPAQQPPAWMPPPTPAYVPPPRARRTGLVLFWPTLALMAIALGTLGVVDVSDKIAVSAYAALALGVVAVMLLIGAFVGRPGGLIALGLACSLGLGVTSIVDATTGGAVQNQDVTETPTSASAVQDTYDAGTGTLKIDLSQVRDVQALDGRHVRVHLDAGEVTVVLPKGVNAEVGASIRYVGTMNVGDDFTRDGFNQSVHRTVLSSLSSSTPTIQLDVDTRVGQIDVVTTTPELTPGN